MQCVPQVILFLVAALLVVPPSYGDDKKPHEIKGWGTVADPAGDCKVGEEGGKLTITIPGTHHNLNPAPGFDNMLAPRVLQAVDGDFALEVTVEGFERPKPKTSSNMRNSFVGAGLLVWQDDKNFIRFERAANGESGRLFVHVELFRDGKFIDNSYATVRNTATHLRLTRKGDTFTFAASTDGKVWFEPEGKIKDVDLPKKLKVGVAATNSTVKEFRPQFENLLLKGK